jgi:hypothetical protein
MDAYKGRVGKGLGHEEQRDEFVVVGEALGGVGLCTDPRAGCQD